MLRSRSFAGDAKLEGCLTQDSAHILQGAVGDYVSKIQVALCIVDSLIIDAGESSGKKYGPSTTGAMLTFKKARNIINRSCQTQADDIVGKMTIAGLDKELVKLENRPAGRVGCVFLGYRHHIYRYASCADFGHRERRDRSIVNALIGSS
jgi:hypothetical protein